MSEALLAFSATPLALVALFVCCFVDGFFPPVPSESFVIVMATLSVTGGGAPLWAVALVAAAGALLGDRVAYAIGRRVPVDRLPFLRQGVGARTLAWARETLQRRGGAVILAGRYVPVGRVAVNMSAGAFGFPLRRFWAFALLAAMTWATYSVLLGVAAGSALHDSPLLAVVVGVAGGAVIGVAVDAVVRRRGRAASRMAGDASTPQPRVPSSGADSPCSPYPHAPRGSLTPPTFSPNLVGRTSNAAPVDHVAAVAGPTSSTRSTAVPASSLAARSTSP